jgi:hypothetical protein
MVDGSPPGTAQFVWDASAGKFRLPQPATEPPARRFIKGPLPLAWLQRAAVLPGKTLHVALGLWYVKGLYRADTFAFKRKLAAELGVSPDATYDALTSLERAGLIHVDRHRGRAPVVTILALPD